MTTEDRRIRIVQCLCPSRHCIMALAFDPAESDDTSAIGRLKEDVTGLLAGGQLDPWCALCLSRDWHYEVGITRFTTISEALPHLMKSQHDQRRTQWRLKSLRESHDS